MNKFISLLLFFSLFVSVNAQTITGKLTDQNGYGLSGMQLKLCMNSRTYDATSATDGSFIFNNVTDVKKTEELPAGYSISDNYPNPFNPKTRIVIAMPNSGRVNVSVYNTLGEKVLEDIEKYYSAGTNNLDLEMKGLPNGIYFARIVLDDKYTVTRKLMLLYGSQHLVSSGSISFSQLKKITSDNSFILDTKIDSLVVTGRGIKKNIFAYFPKYNGTTLALGLLTVNTQRSGVPCPGIPTVTYNGKVYNTVKIGTQCWLKENLNVGTMISGTTNSGNNGKIEKYCYENDTVNCVKYGGLYEWNEAMQYANYEGAGGICPEGWKIPAKADFDNLKLASYNKRDNLLVAGEGTGNNSTGFTALLAGNQNSKSPNFSDKNNSALFWSSTEYNSTSPYELVLSCNDTIRYNVTGSKFGEGRSIRCIKDLPVFKGDSPTAPSLLYPMRDTPENSITPLFIWIASPGAEIYYTLQVSPDPQFSNLRFYDDTSNPFYKMNGYTLEKGTKYYWRVRAKNSNGNSAWSDVWAFITEGVPPVPPELSTPNYNATRVLTTVTLQWKPVNIPGNVAYQIQVAQNENFYRIEKEGYDVVHNYLNISDLTPFTKYFWRVKSISSSGISGWSEVWTFTTLADGEPCPGTPTVTYAGKVYNTIQIRAQCWLKENLDVGTMIKVRERTNSNNGIVKYCYNDDPNNCEKYGGLYSWYDAMNFTTAEKSKGICPDGWHIPTEQDFETLSPITNSLKPGNFSELLGGYLIFDDPLLNPDPYAHSFSSLGNETYFWSSTIGRNSSEATFFNIYSLWSKSKRSGFSVRCIRD